MRMLFVLVTMSLALALPREAMLSVDCRKSPSGFSDWKLWFIGAMETLLFAPLLIAGDFSSPVSDVDWWRWWCPSCLPRSVD